MPCKHVHVSGKRFRVVKPKRLKRLPKGTRFLIPSKNPKSSRRKKHKRERPLRLPIGTFY